MNMKAFRLLFLLLATPALLSAQTTTRGTGSDSAGGTTPSPGGKTNILVIPMYPTMFNVDPDISRAMSKASGQSFEQIRHTFNQALVDQLRKQFGNGFSITSLIDDTVKMKEDLRYVYANTASEWTLTGSPLNPPPPTAQQKPQPGLKNGQVQATTAQGDRFMNTILKKPEVIEKLKTKYKAQYIIFINQLDLKNDLGSDPYNLNGTQTFKRSAVMHFTIFSTATGKRTAAGKLRSEFANTDNTPRAIIQKAFPSLMRQLQLRYQTGLKPEPPKPAGK
jgi:predicted small secreted protein